MGPETEKKNTEREALTLGIIGDPIGHTLSPLMHGIFGERTGTELTYTPYHVRSAGLEEAIRGARALGIRGMNVTVPHKSAVIPYLSSVDPAAERIGAVNTLVTEENGYRGYNTDASGLKRALEAAGTVLAGAHVVILGAGGAARAAVCMCASEGAAEVLIINRTADKAKQLAAEVNAACAVTSVSAAAMEEFLDADRQNGVKYLAIQCTSVGLAPHDDASPVTDPAFFERLCFAVDLIYRPYRTAFLKRASAAGVPVLNGLSMLLYQGADAYELWNPGIRLTDGDLDAAMRALNCAVLGVRGIFLTGFMGCGKSTVAHALAKRLSWEVIDTDLLIEWEAGRSIPEIFAEEGEQAFRDRESMVLARIVRERLRGDRIGTGGVVVSCGGGLPLREDNRQAMACAETGRTIWLRVKPETVAERLAGDTSRPLLAGSAEEKTARITSLMAERGPVYASCADLTVDTDGRTPEEIAEAIVEGLI